MKNKYIYRLLLIGLVLIFYIISMYEIFYNECDNEQTSQKLVEFKNLHKNEINEISMAVKFDNYCYIKIINEKIIENYKEIIINNTFIPDKQVGQFGTLCDLTIKTKKINYTVEIGFNTYYEGMKSDATKIIFFKNPDFDVYDSYINSKGKFLDYNLSKYGHDNYCFHFRNYELYKFMKKYVEEVVKEGKNNKYGIFIECDPDQLR